jgi:hypothetical protein
MSEAYWINGLNKFNESSEWVKDIFFQAHANPVWMEEIYWLGQMSPENSDNITGINNSAPLFQLMDIPGMDHILLHNAVRSLMLGDRQSIFLGHVDAACWLASPQAVGKYNLLPRARLADRIIINPGRTKGQIQWEWISELTQEVELPPSGPVVLAIPSDYEICLGENDPQITFQRLNHPIGSAIRMLNALVESLEKSKFTLGLLMTHPPDGPLQFTWVERI